MGSHQATHCCLAFTYGPTTHKRSSLHAWPQNGPTCHSHPTVADSEHLVISSPAHCWMCRSWGSTAADMTCLSILKSMFLECLYPVVVRGGVCVRRRASHVFTVWLSHWIWSDPQHGQGRPEGCARHQYQSTELYSCHFLLTRSMFMPSTVSIVSVKL